MMNLIAQFGIKLIIFFNMLTEQVKNENLYDRVIKVNNDKDYSDADKIIAYAIYLTFKTEQDSFVNQYYAYLKQNKVCDGNIFNYFP